MAARKKKIAEQTASVFDVPLQLMINVIYKDRGYVWNGAGYVQAVKPEDVDYFLAKKRSNLSCCGPGEDKSIFRRL